MLVYISYVAKKHLLTAVFSQLSILTADCLRHPIQMAGAETIWELHTLPVINSWSPTRPFTQTIHSHCSKLYHDRKMWWKQLLFHGCMGNFVSEHILSIMTQWGKHNWENLEHYVLKPTRMECILIWQAFTSYVNKYRELSITGYYCGTDYVIRKPLPCTNVAKET